MEGGGPGLQVWAAGNRGVLTPGCAGLSFRVYIDAALGIKLVPG